MRRTIRLLAWVSFLIGTSLFRGSVVVQAQSGEGAPPALGLIIRIDPKEKRGALTIKQGKHVNPINAVEGMPIRRGYVLTLTATARATVLCGDGKKRELAPGSQGCPCARPCTPEVCGIRYGGSTIGATRGPDTDDGEFPVVISPRKTMLLNLRPTIRWAAIAGAKETTSYQVTLYGDRGKVVWTKEAASETKLTYPENEPSLTRGQTYKVVVTSGSLSSEQDHSPGLGFTTLTADQARALAADEIKKHQLGLSESQTRFLISNLFAARGLYSEGIDTLEDLYTTIKEPAMAGMLGDLFAMTGLNREAEKRYLEVLSLTAADDFEGLGAMQRSLAQVYENLGMFDRAISRFAEARRAYKRLGYRSLVKALLKDERRLKGAQGRL